MTVDFRRGEWQHLDSAQRFLYRDVMLKTTATPSHWGSFEDVPVDLSREEWPHVDPVQRCLYQDVTLETYSQLCAVGNQVPKPEVVIELEQGEGPWTLEEETPHHSCSDV
ncbi:zinc finger protein 81 isoform X2 [Bubalus bubalis]|uniref:zinc finger protein 81 isoform X2 n=1 Tax=Bubalus bubalis TaxID=89462 RepID=UPI001E1B7082|nr:zinc finger protein 81 isoform X2 [Bubalus bubalis]